MTIDEWKAQASPEAVEQYEKPTDWFRYSVKCCSNCPAWNRDLELIMEYGLNWCNKHQRGTWWDCWCREYSGNAKEDNLLDYAEIKDNYKEENVKE